LSFETAADFEHVLRRSRQDNAGLECLLLLVQWAVEGQMEKKPEVDRTRPEPEEPKGRASRGTSPEKGTEAGWTPPRDESRDKEETNPHAPRRNTL
jgi:hypothetical protein